MKEEGEQREGKERGRERSPREELKRGSEQTAKMEKRFRKATKLPEHTQRILFVVMTWIILKTFRKTY